MKALPSLDQEDVRAVIRLIAEVHGAAGGPAEMKRMLMEGLCELIDADRWFWGLGVQPDPAQTPAYAGQEHGGFTPQAFTAFLQACEQP